MPTWSSPFPARFRLPSKEDEEAHCQACFTKMHYTSLDEYGFCWQCRTDINDGSRERADRPSSDAAA